MLTGHTRCSKRNENKTSKIIQKSVNATPNTINANGHPLRIFPILFLRIMA